MFMGIRILSQNEVQNFLKELTQLESNPNSTPD